MNNRDSTNPGVIDARTLGPKSREEATAERREGERKAFDVPDGRTRRRGRTETISYKVKPEVKRAIHRMAEAEDKSYVEILEAALQLYERYLRGDLK